MQIFEREIFERHYAGNTLVEWGAALTIVVVLLSLVRVIGYLLRRRFHDARSTDTGYDDVILDVVERARLWLLFFPALYLAVRWMELTPATLLFARRVAVVAFLFQVGIWATAVIMFWIGRAQRSKMETDAAAATTIAALGFVARTAIWLVVGLLVLANLNVEITPLIAGLGVGGIAVALAAQKILGDLFASASIVIDKPFVIGDFIVVGEFVGTVEYIGLKTTRVRSLGGEQIIFSNGDLLDSRIRNFKRLLERRVLFGVGVTYQTPREKLARIPEMIRSIIEGVERTRFDRCHFKGFGAFSLDIEAVYHVLAPDYNLYMDIQQQINLAIVDAFQAEGIEFAYPTQTLFVERGESFGVDVSPKE